MNTQFVEWIEPFGPNSEPVYCRVAISTAIATQKYSAQQVKPEFRYPSDEAALEDFIAVHWGKIVEEK